MSYQPLVGDKIKKKKRYRYIVEMESIEMGSWKEELDKKYEEATSTGIIVDIDRANDVILRAIAELNEITNKNLTVSDLLDRFPILYDYDYKWRDSEKFRDMNDLLHELGYELIDDEVKAGDYNDIKGYFGCKIKRRC